MMLTNSNQGRLLQWKSITQRRSKTRSHQLQPQNPIFLKLSNSFYIISLPHSKHRDSISEKPKVTIRVERPVKPLVVPPSTIPQKYHRYEKSPILPGVLTNETDVTVYRGTKNSKISSHNYQKVPGTRLGFRLCIHQTDGKCKRSLKLWMLC
jgi:cell envelope opacity-associated protein A